MMKTAEEKKAMKRPKLPLKFPIRNVEVALEKIDALLKHELYSSHLLTWRATFLQLSETGNGKSKLESAQKSLEQALRINPQDVEALIEGIRFFDIVVPRPRKVAAYARRLEEIRRMIAETLRDIDIKTKTVSEFNAIFAGGRQGEPRARTIKRVVALQKARRPAQK